MLWYEKIGAGLEKVFIMWYNQYERLRLYEICRKRSGIVIKYKNHLGTIGLSTAYLRQLISSTAESCFGVAGMNVYGAKQGVIAVLRKENTTKGVIIRQDGEQLVVDLHITVNYGINVGAIVESIIHKVTYVLQEQANVKVKSVNVFIDEMING